jgi:methyl-accepting chemotaxis protein
MNLDSDTPSRGDARSVWGDQILLATILISALATLVLGFQLTDALWAISGVALLVMVAAVAYVTLRGTLSSRLLLTSVVALMVMLQIQLTQGVVEYHFGVFVALALVMVYLDWRPIVLAALLFAVHHLVFDRLLAAGLNWYCLSEPNLPMVLLHATYVVVQTGLELALVAGMAKAATEGQELQKMVELVNQPAGISLRLAGFEAKTVLGQALQRMLTRMDVAVSTVHESVASISLASSDIASGNQNLSSRTENAAAGIQQTAASMEELAATLEHSTSAANQAKTMANDNAVVAEKCGEVVTQVVATMADINTSSRKISDIIGVIDGIAFQTNILALNAAVEAARAGEQGRGFAVVASEVRNLAQRSALAAKEIKDLIGASVDKVEAGTLLVQSAGSTMQEVVTNANKVSVFIEEITRATSEQSISINEVTQAVTQLDRMTQQNAALVEQSLASSNSLRDQATQLNGVVGLFQRA